MAGSHCSTAAHTGKQHCERMAKGILANCKGVYGASNVDPHKTDALGLLQLMINCKEFHSLLDTQKAKEIRLHMHDTFSHHLIHLLYNGSVATLDNIGER